MHPYSKTFFNENVCVTADFEILQHLYLNIYQ